MVALVDVGVVTAQPEATDRKARISLALWNAGFLQQGQSPAARSYEDELGRHRSPLAALGVFDLDPPSSVLLAG
jgi:hypothetical protein